MELHFTATESKTYFTAANHDATVLADLLEGANVIELTEDRVKSFQDLGYKIYVRENGQGLSAARLLQ